MTRARDIASGIDYITGIDAGEVLPHIIPGVLYPAVAGKLLDGSTSHSGNYGTAQSDGKSYYYTDIKGSKPIKDPRIGGHFGSQRHMFTSIQLLEQETATHGKNVYSVDGREWIRVVDGTGTWLAQNNAEGAWIYQNGSDCTGMVIEITGYFNDINTLNYTYTNNPNDIDIKVNGTMSHEGHTTCAGNASVETPLGARYVRSASLSNFGSTVSTSLGTSPAINTIHIECTNGSSEYWRNFGIELIAQDTTSTANKSKIQIPSQNVVSYGKKFTVSGTPHYDPFNGFTNDTTLFSSVVDVATSLGLGTATTWGAPWDKGSDNHIRPFNGGRVVKWVDSSGTIKTSVTMMPANAQNVGNNQSAGSAGTASNEITTASATNSHTINFSDDVIDHSLSEVAKSFLPFEFGNGAANGGNTGTWLDCSMLDDAGSRDIAYVMDDGLTSLSGEDVRRGSNDRIVFTTGTSDFWYLTFIGTGITLGARNANVEGDRETIAQNLPYGTHILKLESDGTTHQTTKITIDGILVKTTSSNNNFEYGGFYEIIIHQPKKPPIPEDAVVLADYMLMADFVPVSGTANYDIISKGVRWQSSSRDVFADETDGDSMSLDHYVAAGYDGFHLAMSGTADSDTSVGVRLPFFGTNWVSLGYQHDTRLKLYEGAGLSSTDKDSASTKNNDTNEHSYAYLTSNLDLGTYVAGVNCVSGQTLSWYGFQIVSPIHSSSHYQSFETPFLNELVGGDRNMEQNNLIVTADGKTWDEVTRDTSYLSKNLCVNTNLVDNKHTAATVMVWDRWRGNHGNYASSYSHMMNKNFAIAYDRLICLVPGDYYIQFGCMTNDAASAMSAQVIKVNGTNVVTVNAVDADWYTCQIQAVVTLKRGDYVQTFGFAKLTEIIYYITRA